MIIETFDKTELLTDIDKALNSVHVLMSTVDNDNINTVPYKDSWTAGELLRHITKSTYGMAKAMSADSKPAERNPGERIPELEKAFLDFSNKMKSPEPLVPEKGPYEKQAAMEELNNSFKKFKESTNNANLTDEVNGLPLGPITKWEILHFVLYHTLRHANQLNKISDALKNH